MVPEWEDCARLSNDDDTLRCLSRVRRLDDELPAAVEFGEPLLCSSAVSRVNLKNPIK